MFDCIPLCTVVVLLCGKYASYIGHVLTSHTTPIQWLIMIQDYSVGTRVATEVGVGSDMCPSMPVYIGGSGGIYSIETVLRWDYKINESL